MTTSVARPQSAAAVPRRDPMPRAVLLAIFLAALVLFFFANRAAYKGWFSSDDLDKTGWPAFIPIRTFYLWIFTPKFSPINFRPIGYLYYRFLFNAFHLWYAPYVAVLQAFHILNLLLLFVLLRRLDFSRLAAAAATLFYAFHAALIDAFWQPQYIFEVFASVLSIATMLLYLRGRWILGLITFWLAYKSKEIAVTLPAALLAYEWLLGERKWKRLIPYLLISLNFGLQALWNNRTVGLESNYVLRFSPHLLWTTISYYSSTILWVPFAGFALLLLPLFVRDRRVYLGLLFMAALFVPMIVLPGRLERVYWYIPMIGLVMALAVVASRTPAWAIALFFAVWLPVNYVVLRDKRRDLLATGDEHRWYTTGLIDYARHVPKLKAVVFQGIPERIGEWGIVAAIHHAFGNDVDVAWYESPKAREALANVPMAIVGYYPVMHIVKGLLRTRPEPGSYIRFKDEIPMYQFGSGWEHEWGVLGRVSNEAELTLFRPGGSKQFQIVAGGPATLTVLEDDRSLGTQTLTTPGVEPMRWQLPPAAPGARRITIRSEKPRVAVLEIGYVEP